MLCERKCDLDLENLRSALQRVKKLRWPIPSENEEHCCVAHDLLPGMMYFTVSNRQEDTDSRNTWFDIFKLQNVHTIIRVGGSYFLEQEAEEYGFRCVSCECDGVIPQPGVVSSFLYTVRKCGLRGVVVISDGKRGHAATLCALHLMHGYGFSAGEATAWLRIVCPRIQISATQENFLRAVSSGVEDGEAEAGGRDFAFRRAVYRVWAKDLRRDSLGRKLQSAFEGVKPESEPKVREATAAGRCWNHPSMKLSALAMAVDLLCVLRGVDCSARCACQQEKVAPAVERWAVPLQQIME